MFLHKYVGSRVDVRIQIAESLRKQEGTEQLHLQLIRIEPASSLKTCSEYSDGVDVDEKREW